MNGIKFLLDTNVVIGHLGGNHNLEALLEGASLYISSVTLSELLCGNLTSAEESILADYLNVIHTIHTNDFICVTGAKIRRENRLKLPDALIAATSLFLNIPLITFDQDFDKVDDLQIIKLIP